MIYLFFVYSLLLLLTTIGFGLILTKILKVENFNYNYGTIGILGLFNLSLIASYTHLVFPHNYLHNILVITVGVIGLFFFGKDFFKRIKFVLIVFSLLFLALIISKTNEDFGYYHLPNSLQFSQQKLQFGLGNLNHGFKHVSSLFMIMSLSYLPLIDYYLFNLTNFLFLTFFVIFLIEEIFSKKKINLNITNLFLSFFLVLILAKFSRLAEYGSDLSGQIVIFIFFFFIFEFYFNKKILNYALNYLKIAIIFFIFAVTLKFISAIYIFLFTPFFLIKGKRKEFILRLFRLNYFILIFSTLLIFFFLNFTSTGCFIYPVEITCFTEQFDWSISSDTIKNLNLHYETWSKAGSGPGISVDNKEYYIKSFNWVPNWLKEYFIGKVSDYIFVSIVIMIFFTIFFKYELFFSKKQIFKKDKNYLLFYFSLIIIFVIWFLNFPALRYAGYAVVFLLLIFPFLQYLSSKVDASKDKNLKKLAVIFLISYSVFIYKNITRMHNELKLPETYHHNFENFPFFWVDKKNYEKIKLNDHQLYFTSGSCWSVPSTCVRDLDSIKVIKKNNYIFYIKK